MTFPMIGAQRASRPSTVRLLIALIVTIVALAGWSAHHPSPVQAATARKVVVIVGPVESATASWVSQGKALAAQAKGYGANVVEIYSPNATWAKVQSLAQGANILIYIGHGNGWPSPYPPFQETTKDGLGLNATANAGNNNHKYYGANYVKKYIKLAKNAVVILNHLCYASGDSEPGNANPTITVAKQRVDNYAAGFIAAGARAVFADGNGSPSYILKGLFTTSMTMRDIFWSDGSSRTYAFAWTSTRTPGTRNAVAPYAPNRYYKSIAGQFDLTAATWRAS